jgi:tRNA pseudouridine synthase 10
VKCSKRTGIHGYAKPNECLICSGILWKVDEIADEIVEKLKDYEFETFLVGSRVYGSLKALEDYLNLKDSKSLKHQFNRELSRAIASKTGKRFDPKEPDVTIIYDLENPNFEIQIAPLYIYGRYKKRVRGLSQTRWLCGFCNGKGCEICGWTGKRYISVEEMIAEPMREFVGGRHAVLHGSGREDVDARMLGSGRPFIVEIQEPKRRKIDLKELERIVNERCKGKVVIFDLKFAKARDVEFLKSAGFRKVYRAKVIFEREISREELERALEKLKTEIHQRTPLRVLHRRADLVRVRRVHNAEVILHRGRVAVIRIEADSGLYIKELVSGDQGRTKPSLSELLGVQAYVEKLDVIEVKGGL